MIHSKFYLSIIVVSLLTVQCGIAMQETTQDLKGNLAIELAGGQNVKGLSASTSASILTDDKILQYDYSYDVDDNNQLVPDSERIKGSSDVIQLPKNNNYNLITSYSSPTIKDIIVLAGGNELYLYDSDTKKSQQIKNAHSTNIVKLCPCHGAEYYVGGPYETRFTFATGSAFGNVREWEYQPEVQKIFGGTTNKIRKKDEASGTRNYLLGTFVRSPVYAERQGTISNALLRKLKGQEGQKTLEGTQAITFTLKRLGRGSALKSPNFTVMLMQKQPDEGNLPIITAFNQYKDPGDRDSDNTFALLYGGSIKLWQEDKGNKIIYSNFKLQNEELKISNNIKSMHFLGNYLVLVTRNNKIFAISKNSYSKLRVKKEPKSTWSKFLKFVSAKKPQENLELTFTPIQPGTLEPNDQILYSATNNGSDDYLWLITKNKEGTFKLHVIKTSVLMKR